MVTDNAHKFCISGKYPSILLSTHYKPQLDCCGSVATCPALPGTSSMSYKSYVPRQPNCILRNASTSNMFLVSINFQVDESRLIPGNKGEAFTSGIQLKFKEVRLEKISSNREYLKVPHAS